MSKKVLVTGATGNIASLVIPQLIQAGLEVNAYIHDAAKGAQLTDQGVKVFVGEFTDQEKMNEAATGVDAVLAITPPNPDAVAQGEVILRAAQNAGSPYYVRISAIGAAADAPTENGKLHYVSDQDLIDSGLTYTILRPHFFMQNLFGSVDGINSDGNIYLGMGEGSLGMVDVRDIADSAASLLINGGHDNKIYTLTGPESMQFGKAATILSESTGKQINYVSVPLEAVREAILGMGWGDWGAQIMVDYSKAYAEGWGDFTNNDVESITGNKSRSFKQFSDDMLSHALN
jgi:uncharacterized protein YbjT (DUF2867 family)